VDWIFDPWGGKTPPALRWVRRVDLVMETRGRKKESNKPPAREPERARLKTKGMWVRVGKRDLVIHGVIGKEDYGPQSKRLRVRQGNQGGTSDEQKKRGERAKKTMAKLVKGGF